MMKESPLNRDEKTGGLSGSSGSMDGILPGPAATVPGVAGLRLPERLTAVSLEGGRPQGVALPALGDREVVAAWRSTLGSGPLYVRCLDRRAPLPVAQVQRLARVGELWLDCAVPDDEAGFELMVAGAHRLVLWPAEASAIDRLDSLGDSAVLGWDGATDWPALVELALAHGVPVLCAADPGAPAPGLDLYRVDLAASGPSVATRIQSAEPVEVEDPAGDDEDE